MEKTYKLPETNSGIWKVPETGTACIFSVFVWAQQSKFYLIFLFFNLIGHQDSFFLKINFELNENIIISTGYCTYIIVMHISLTFAALGGFRVVNSGYMCRLSEASLSCFVQCSEQYFMPNNLPLLTSCKEKHRDPAICR